MIFTKSVSNILLFNRDGKTPSKSNDKASLIIAKAFSKVAVEDKKLFAINRIKQLPMEIEKITSTKPIEIAGIAGYEIVADDKDKKTGKREKTYQVILFSDSLYYLFFGSAHSDFDTNIVLLRKTAKTFKRK